VDSESQGRDHEPQTHKHGVLRAYALFILIEAILVALLWAAHVPQGVIVLSLILLGIVFQFGARLTGPTFYVQILSPSLEQKIQIRYRLESGQLSNLGFTSLFFYGQGFQLFRLLLIYPAFVSLIMLLNREVATVEGGSKLLFGFPVFISGNRTTYAHPNQLGMKFHTRFQDGTILMTKNFGGKKKYGPTVVVHRMSGASISDAWAEHQKQIQNLEAAGKQADHEISFLSFVNISNEA
jgi:hypothetical protein